MTRLADYVSARAVADGDCLRWVGTTYNGHPGGTVGGKKVLIRRALYEATHGPIPKGRILRCVCETPLCVVCVKLTTYRAVALECGARGLMSGQVRSARIAAAKRAGRQAKITQDNARAIRQSDDPLSVWSARLNICASTVSKIRRGTLRRDFTGDPWQGLGACARRIT